MNKPNLGIATVSGDDLAQAATHALTSPGYHSTNGFVRYPTAPSMCEQFVREVTQSLYPMLFDFAWSGTAYQTMRRFINDARYVIPTGQPLQRGDILFWGLSHGPDGHTAFVIAGGRIAENSIVHYSNSHPDARGTRLLADIDPPTAVVRLSIYSKGRGHG